MPLQCVRALAFAGAFALAAAAHPQTQPRVPLPGQVEREFTPPPALRAPAPKLPAAPPVLPGPPPTPDVKLVVREITVEGSTVYSQAELAPYFAPLLGKEVSLDDIHKLAADLTARYAADGYFLSRVLVPAQEIEAGRVRLTAIEGYIAQVRFQGARPEHEGLLDAYAARIRAGRPIRLAALERYLLLMNDLAGVEARSTLVTSLAGVGAADLVVDYAFTHASGQLGGDNRGSRALGPWRVLASGERNSLFGRYDKTRLFASSTLNDEQNYVSLFHAQPIGAEGARLALTGWGAWARPDPSTQGGLSTETTSWSGGLFHFYPVVRSRAVNLTTRFGFVAEGGRTQASGVTVTDDDLRVVRAGVSLDAVDRFFGSNVVDVEFAQGLNALGARQTTTVALPVTTGKNDFTKLAAYAARLQPLDANWSIFAAVSGQYAFSNVPSLAAFAVGGEYFGRGYDPSEIVGDSGVSVKLDLQRALGAIGAAALQGYAFYDFGAVYQRDAFPGQPKRLSLASAGLGLRVRYRTALYGYVEAAKPLTLTPTLEGDKDPRLYVGLFWTF